MFGFDRLFPVGEFCYHARRAGARRAKSVLAWCAIIAGIIVVGAARTGRCEQGQFQSYTLRHKRAEQVRSTLDHLFTQMEAEADIVIDARRNRILVQGSAAAHEITRSLLDALDRPSKQADSKPVFRSYRVLPARLDAEASQLRRRYADWDTVAIATDDGTRQLLVLAPPSVHAEIGRRLDSTEPSKRVQRSQVVPERGRQFVPLRKAGTEQVEFLLRQLLGSRLVRRNTEQAQSAPTAEKVPLSSTTHPRAARQGPDEPTGRRSYTLKGAGDHDVGIVFDPESGGVFVEGVSGVVRQGVQLLEALDDVSQKPGQTLRIVPLKQADPVKVMEAVRAMRQQQSRVAPEAPQGPSNELRDPDAQPTPEPIGRRSRLNEKTALVNYLFQESPQGEAAAAQDAAGELPAGEPDEEEPPLRAFGTDVEIQTLPDLDVVILRGGTQDVEQLLKIIEEIERISAENQPLIEVYNLKHANGEIINQLITEIETDLFEVRQGRVSITPLVKPNALLLIGWGEALNAAKELIRKLDQPVSPRTQMKVYRLRNMPVQQASTAVTEFFSGRTGQETMVQVTADVRTNSLVVHAAPRDLAEVDLLLQRLDVADSAAVNQVKVFELKNSLAEDLAQTLQNAIEANTADAAQGPGKSAVLELVTVDADGERILKSGVLSDVQITPDIPKNTVIVTGPAASMPLIAGLIQRLDESPASVAQIKVFRITNGDAADLVQMLRSLLPEKTGAAPAPQLAGAEGETSLAPLRLSIDERTNSIIATGAAGDLEIIEALLLRLDEREVRNRETTVYRLKNAPAVDVATAINEFLRSERQVIAAEPGTVSPFRRIEREVVVVPEIVSNSIIISATPRFYQDIIDLVEQLDAEPPQVVIQVLIASVDLQNTDEFGVELGLQDSLLFDRSLLENIETITNTAQQSTDEGIITATEQIIQAANLTPGFNFTTQQLGNSGSDRSLTTSDRVGSQAVSVFDVGRINNELGFGGLVLSASSESVSVLVRALQACRRLEVLARPQVMTLDNQSAFIQVGQRVPRVTGTTITEVGQVNSVTLENVGLILGVTPRISPTGMVVMEIDAERSELAPESEGIPISFSSTGEVLRSPPINTTTAQTTVSAMSGETIILGGLITKSTGVISRRVPYLSNIPVLGDLFRYDAEDQRRDELLIIMTPHVVRSPEEAERIRHLEESRISWTLADVQEVHGEGGVCHDDDCPYCRARTPVVYPDFNPRGTVPETPDAEGELVVPPELGPYPGPSADPPQLPVEPTAFEKQDSDQVVGLTEQADRRQMDPATHRDPTSSFPTFLIPRFQVDKPPVEESIERLPPVDGGSTTEPRILSNVGRLLFARPLWERSGDNEQDGNAKQQEPQRG